MQHVFGAGSVQKVLPARACLTALGNCILWPGDRRRRAGPPAQLAEEELITAEVRTVLGTPSTQGAATRSPARQLPRFPWRDGRQCPQRRLTGPPTRATSCSVTMASFRYDLLGQIHVAFEDIHLTPGVANHRIVLPTQIAATWLNAQDPASNAQVLVTGTIWTEQPSFLWVAGLAAQVLSIRGYAAGEELVVSLTDDQLICLERARGQDDMALRLKLQATLLTPPDGVHPVAHEEVPVRIPRTRWLELLDQAGTEVGVLVRVSSPLTDSALSPPPAVSDENAASLAQAAARLRQARAELRDQQWEHCVATCRRVLENISRLVSIPSGKSVTNTPGEQRNQEQRWAAIYWDVKSMASAAHHDDSTTEGFSWSRADAEAILAATAGLLGKYTHR